MLDLGANADAKPEHLVQYAFMGSIYSEKVRGIENPRVGLLNIGTEEKKGNELTKHSIRFIKKSTILTLLEMLKLEIFLMVLQMLS